jgi:23S rRNA pseudouridine1911/1915/1917 synthase
MTAPLDELEPDDDRPLDPVDVTPAYARSRDPVELHVKVKAEGMRLDHYLQIFFKDSSRSELQKAIASGHVTVNGKPAKASYKVRNDDKLWIQLPEPIHDVIVPEDIPLDVLYEDEVLAVVNKPADMVVHPARGNWTGTLVNALAHRFQNALSSANGNYRLGIVHRLDRDTTGAILIAKTDRAHSLLSMQFESRKVFKEYVAIAVGELDRDSDYIEAKLKQHPHEREKQVVAADDDPEGKEACSYYEVLERFRGYTLVKVQPRTGRTHQIRVHLAHVHCPVLADRVYGGRDRFRLADVVPGLPRSETDTLIQRQALHAFRLRFLHPNTGHWLEVEAPLPPDMRAALEAIRTHRPYRG